MSVVVLAVAASVAAYLYAAAVCWRVGHPRKHGHRVWSRPRPTRILHHGAHAKPRTPKPTTPKPTAAADTEQADTTGLAVAA